MKIAHLAGLRLQAENDPKNAFCPLEIIKYIESQPVIKSKSITMPHISMHVYNFSSSLKDDVEAAAKEAIGIWNWLAEITTKKSSSDAKQALSVSIWFTPFPKKWNNPQGKIGCKEINSGQYDPTNHSITIWRFEDWRYVLMHEYLHALQFDQDMQFPLDEAWVTFAGLFYHTVYRCEAVEEIKASWHKQYRHLEKMARHMISLSPSLRGSAQWYILMSFQMMPSDAQVAARLLEQNQGPSRRDQLKPLTPLNITEWPFSLRLVG